MEPSIFNTAQAAEYITAHLLPSGSKPLTPRSVARFAKLNKIDGAYMMKGEWCFTKDVMAAFVKGVLSSKGRSPYRKRKNDTKSK